MALGDSHISQQKSDRFGLHTGPPIGMDRQLSRLNLLFFTSLFNQFLRQGGQFPVGHHPPHHVSAEDIEDHVKIIVRPLYRPFEFRDIPTPELIGRLGKQLGLLVMG